MQEIKDLSLKEWSDLQTNASNWNERHKDHVQSIREETSYSYPPSGSDMLRPELWKGAHWNWFFGSLPQKPVKKGSLLKLVMVVVGVLILSLLVALMS